MPARANSTREVRGVVDRAAALDALVAEEPAAEHEVARRRARARRDRPRAAGARGLRASRRSRRSRVFSRREERRHRVGVGVVQLDAVEAGLLRARRRGGEQAGQHLRQLADVRQVHVGDALARAEVAAPRARAASSTQPSSSSSKRGELLAHLGSSLGPRGRRARERELAVRSVIARKRWKYLSGSGRRRIAQEVDDLDEQPRLARRSRSRTVLDEVAPGPGGSGRGRCAAAGRSGCRGCRSPRRRSRRAARGEAAVPVEHLGRDEAVLGGAPRAPSPAPRCASPASAARCAPG